MQSVPIATKVGEFESRVLRGVLDTTLCDKVCQWLAVDRWFSPGTPVSSANKTDCHDINEMLFVESGVKYHNPNLNPKWTISVNLMFVVSFISFYICYGGRDTNISSDDMIQEC